ncbi:MAG: citramalate synthase [Candidatus Moranbacteria bacterium]|nr:citramalate synthase [Candidatus Moranbacteria bacterium]
MRKIQILDTTLRDGTQGENISFSASEKLMIAKKLDQTGFDYIEGGWPGSNPKDKEFFKKAKKIKLKKAKITAFGSTRRKNILAKEDFNLAEIVKSGASAAAIFGKTWDLHVQKVMNNSLKENLLMIEDSIRFLKKTGMEVIYDAEHFFDGFKANPSYALKTLHSAVKGGSKMLVLCDTNGGALNNEINRIIKRTINEFKGFKNIKFGIHAHNDGALAVANSLSAVRAGVSMVHGTINGYGERCGNADLTAVIPNLELKMDYNCIGKNNLKKLKEISDFVSELANQVPQNNRPFVGKSAFAHKGGIHVSAILKERKAYEHLRPQLVGNKRRVIVSDLSGKSNIEYKAKELGVKLKDDQESQIIARRIKKLENKGYQFDSAEGSLKLLLDSYKNKKVRVFDLESFRVTVEKDKEKPCVAHAIVKIAVKGKREITAAEGDGPVSALDNAIRKALDKFFPKISSMRLVDFKVRVIDGKLGTGAKVRVLIESRDSGKIWTTIGVSDDIIEASWQALADSFYYYLKSKKK